ncbi:ATP-binding protein [Chitinophaga sp. sic0106]|uniref:AAA family ATPase n=1 Tax=Chitinophaga sp. sic0106 TaxID=2854785 RepID=UPI001C492F84|nr:ATP-binding protein [Chitinophaga sp. sic0106]MBV7533821.1 AAA family ATPase [Chitinophaga sp. sic0106]
MERLIGREKEIVLLDQIKESKASSFVAVYGRRRVGKTFLIRQVFDNKFDFQLTGMSNVNLSQQLANFHTSLIKYHPSAHSEEPPADWFTAFQQLIDLLESSRRKKKIIFLDELPWLDTAQSNFIPALEHFWNSWASARNDVILIVCGSAAGWMINKLINSKGGLHNRVTHRLRLEPFTLRECESFFNNRKARFDRYQLIQLYMVMGGIPFYLEQVDIRQSAAQNINKLCFDKDGILRSEFDNLYQSLFDNAEKHIAIIETLSKKSRGLTRGELIKGAKVPTGGSVTRLLKELEESGFIRKYISYGKKERNSLYQLTDFYSLFYLKFVKKASILDENSWINSLDSPEQRSWSGYAYEQICLAHIKEVKNALGISGVQTITSSWISTNTTAGAQIDLVIDRRDQVINICEMKFSISKYTIDKRYAEELRNKIGIFKEETKTRKAIFLTIITTFGLNRNSYADSMVQNSLTMDILFK